MSWAQAGPTHWRVSKGRFFLQNDGFWYNLADSSGPYVRLNATQYAMANTSGSLSYSPTTGAVSAGGVSLGIVGQNSINVNSRFGVVGDGVTDNAAALTLLQTYLKTMVGQRVNLWFNPGTYLYSNSNWVQWWDDVVVHADGCKFQCTGTSYPNFVFNAYYPLQDYTGTYNYGYTFNTVAIGATSVTLVSSSNATNFSVGMPVLLWGFNQLPKANYPPGPRYFQYTTVTAVNNGTGVITLADPCQAPYDSTWRDLAGPQSTMGAARIVPLRRTNYWWPTRIEIIGATLLSNPNQAGGDQMQWPAQELVCRQMTANATSPYNMQWDPSGCKKIFAEECNFNNIELDELVTEYRSKRNVYQNSIIGGHSYDLIDLDGDHISTSATSGYAPVAVGGVNVNINRCDIDCGLSTQYTAIQTVQGGIAGKALNFGSNRIIGFQSQSWVVDNSNGALNANSVVTGAPGPNNEITVAGGSDTPGAIGLIRPGTFMYLSTYGNSGRVLSVAWDNTNTRYLIRGTWQGAVVNGNTWYFEPLQQLNDLGGNTVEPPLGLQGAVNVAAPQLYVRHPSATQLARPGAPFRYRWDQNTFTTGSDNGAGFLGGHLHRLTMTVAKPYSAAGTNIELILYHANGSTVTLEKDTSKVGTLQAGPEGSYSTTSETAWSGLIYTSPIVTLQLHWQYGAPSTNVTLLPEFSIEIEAYPMN